MADPTQAESELPISENHSFWEGVTEVPSVALPAYFSMGLVRSIKLQIVKSEQVVHTDLPPEGLGKPKRFFPGGTEICRRHFGA
jgi:hypothetical protein